jgi:hypothetical protein
MEKADLRAFVLKALRQKPRAQFDEVHYKVADIAPEYDRAHDGFLVREIIWELLVQGVLASGISRLSLELGRLRAG